MSDTDRRMCNECDAWLKVHELRTGVCMDCEEKEYRAEKERKILTPPLHRGAGF